MGEFRIPYPGWYWVLLGGLVAGTLDLAFAISFWFDKGVPPVRILQSIAAGVLGANARDGGWGSGTLGAVLHYLIAFGMAAAYYGASLLWPALRRNVFAFGTVYGLLLYAVMRYIVVPLSAAPAGPTGSAAWIASSMLAHVALVGIPCAWFARRARPVRHAG